ncbi:MAG: kelch repeat-containing protein [Planctomycetes bacterium]|nr:kelch repeat-containing protein [Planctomycetota bacterium]
MWGASLEYDITSDIIYLFGGCLDLTGGTYNNDVYQFRVSTGEWTRHQLTGGPAPSAGRATYSDAGSDRIFVFGGSNSGGSNMFNDFFVLDISAATPVWVTVTSTGTPVGREFATLGYDTDTDKIYLLGGFDGTTGQKQMFVFSFSTGDWQQQTVSVPTGLIPENVHSSSGVWDPEHLRFFNAPAQRKKFQSVTITTGGASWHDLASPPATNTVDSAGVYDSTLGYYICLFGKKVIKGQPTKTNIVKSFKVK